MALAVLFYTQEQIMKLLMEEDGGGSARQSWMETSGLWSYASLGATRQQVISIKLEFICI